MTSVDDLPIATALHTLRQKIADAAKAAGRDPASIELLAVSKTQGPELIEQVIAAGQSAFGENRVQEAAAKYPPLKARYPNVRLHLIGPLQTNKARDAVRLFDVIETLDRPRLAEALAAAMQKEGRQPQVFVQVNTGEETQKGGVAPAQADRFITEVRERWNLPIVGLMCIPPVDEEPSLHFALLREIGHRNGLNRLSMGMSADYEIAIRFGATEIRIGTAIFGERASPKQ
jgi:PLP dependent protein